ncbi:MAG: transferase family protein [Rhodospirillaceae bacterium]|nr:MAG: transferase family protein [Rhodospirillaceae bacterium]
MPCVSGSGGAGVTLEEFSRLLIELHLARETVLRREFDRSLPLADGLFDRWERARRLGFGEGASLYDSAFLFGPVTVGAHTWIGPNTILDGSGGGVCIGTYCSVSAGVHIYTHDTVLWALSGGRAPHREGAVTLGDNVHVGAQSVIVAGVTIGSRCVIAANSMVNRDVPNQTIVGGTPARVLGHVEGEGTDVRMVFDKKDIKESGHPSV